MTECRDLEPLFASYVDGDAPSGDCARVDAHLRACPPCRDRVAGERVARQIVVSHRVTLKACASPDLRRRCEAARLAPAPVPAAVLARRSWVPLSMVATLVLAVGGVFLYGLKGGAEALAAQLVVDHVKCFQAPPAPTIIPDASALSREWATVRGWSVKIPGSATGEQLELLGVRRCISSDGTTAHVMYKWHGQPLSVYVLNSESRRVGPVPRLVERFGEEAVMWTWHGQTFAVVSRGRPSDVEHVAQYVRAAAQ